MGTLNMPELKNNISYTFYSNSFAIQIHYADEFHWVYNFPYYTVKKFTSALQAATSPLHLKYNSCTYQAATKDACFGIKKMPVQ